MRHDIDAKRDWIVAELEKGVPRIELCRILECRYDTLAARLTKWECTTKNQAGKGIARPARQTPLEAYLAPGGPGISSAKLREKLIEAGLKERKCEECGLDSWRGKPLPLELDHLNGNHFDNRLENLRIKCPNCHSQAPTNAGKNKGAYTHRSEPAAPDVSADKKPGRKPAIEIETQELCQYGCGCVAKYANGSGGLMCDTSANRCPAIRAKNAQGLLRCYEQGRDGKAIASRRVYSAEARAKQGWSKGQTKETSPAVKRVADQLKGTTHKGVPRSLELRQKDSENRMRALERAPHVKWLELPTGLKVQGSWEYNVGLRLLALGLELSRVRLRYDQVRTYTPDFCVGHETYIEVKGWMSRRDALKYEKFFDEHPNTKVILIRNEGGSNNYTKFIAGQVALSDCEDLQTVVRQYLARVRAKEQE